MCPKHELIVLVNKGLLAVAQNDYTEAHNLFQQAHELDKTNVMVNAIVRFLSTLAVVGYFRILDVVVFECFVKI